MNDAFFNSAILDSAQQCPLWAKVVERIFGFVLRSQGLTLTAWDEITSASMQRLIDVNKVSLADLAKRCHAKVIPSGPHDERDVEGAVAALADIRCEPRSALCRMEDRAPATALSIMPESFCIEARALPPRISFADLARSG